VLECFPGQFRNWFYALLSMSTMMEGIPPFKALVGHALVRDEHGKEMHKSTGNAIWFDDAAEKMGADVMRWMYCGQVPTNNLNFGYGPGEQVRRRVFSTWWNVYSFFINYARLDGFDPKRPAVPYDKLQDIDRWLLSKLQELIRAGNQSLSDYNVPALIAEAESFIERLSNWYVRRNRRRYWRPRSDSDTDKLAAYQTLYKVLVDMARVLATIVPFMTDEMYQNLVRSMDDAAPESIHHCQYPQFDAALHNETLSADMDMVADVVSRTLSIREAKQLRVRQPLARLIVVSDEHGREVLNRFMQHISEELNIKSLEVVPSLDSFVKYTVKPNLKTLGPRLGKNMKAAAGLIAAADAGTIARPVAAKEKVTLGELTLEPEDFLVDKSIAENLVLSDSARPAIILDTLITPELLREGLARDIVRHIQQLRKDSGLEITDRIIVEYSSSQPDVLAAIEEYRAYIRSETLCDSMTASTGMADGKEIKAGGLELVLALRKK
jgi:isoleucyl-tRNA synthetase